MNKFIPVGEIHSSRKDMEIDMLLAREKIYKPDGFKTAELWEKYKKWDIINMPYEIEVPPFAFNEEEKNKEVPKSHVFFSFQSQTFSREKDEN